MGLARSCSRGESVDRTPFLFERITFERNTQVPAGNLHAARVDIKIALNVARTESGRAAIHYWMRTPCAPTDAKVSIDTIVQLIQPFAGRVIAFVYGIRYVAST
jgi:hypothetical protein